MSTMSSDSDTFPTYSTAVATDDAPTTFNPADMTQTPPWIVIIPNANPNYFAYSFYAYFLVLIVVLTSLIVVKIVQRRQALAEQLSASQRREAERANAASDQGFPKHDDLPPSYEVVQAQLNAKNLLHVAEEGNAVVPKFQAILPQNSSSATMETEYATSHGRINANMSTELIPPPPTYDSIRIVLPHCSNTYSIDTSNTNHS